MSDNDPYHFTSELIELLTSVIPLLNRSKRGVLTFFRSCGVPDSMTADLRERVYGNPDSISKYEIARTVLKLINDGGDRMLRQRREVIKQVTEFEDYELCWPDDQLRAKGLVSDVRRHVNVKDSFTRMQQAEEDHRLKEARQKRQATEAKQKRRDDLAALRTRLASLGSVTNPQQRGLALEGVLNDLFRIDGLSIRDAFTIKDENGQVQEQIDGLIALDGQPILVEAKWHSVPIGQGEISRHLVRLYGRAGVVGLFVSSSAYTDPAIKECENALSQRVIVLAEVNEILMLLEDPDANLGDWLRAKIMAATVDRKPLFLPSSADTLCVTPLGASGCGRLALSFCQASRANGLRTYGGFVPYAPPDAVDNRRARARRPELHMAAPAPSPALPRLAMSRSAASE